MTSPGRISFFITLGIAAIDMLTCAFISTVMMFVMFLTPRDSSQATVLAPQDVLMMHWVFPGSPGALFGLQVGPPGNNMCLLWSDENAEQIQDRCAPLSKMAKAGAIRVFKSGARSVHDPTQDGLLAIAEPIAGSWTVNVIYADTADHAITLGRPVVATISVVAKEAAVVQVPLEPGQETQLTSAANAGTATSLKSILDIK
ncbi:hypothetical protein [Azospirillum endophyticum]